MSQILPPVNGQQYVQQGYQQRLAQPSQAGSPSFSANENANNAPVATDKLVQSNPLLSAASSTPENPVSFLGQAAGALAGLFGLNYIINEPLYKGRVEDTFYQKIVNLGDKLGQNSKVQKAVGWLDSMNAKANARIDGSKILKTLFREESLGGSMVMGQAKGTSGHLANRAVEVMKAYAKEYDYHGFDELIQKAEKDSYKYYDEIMQAIKAAPNKEALLTNRPWWGLGLIKNKKSLQEIINKDKLVQFYKGNASDIKRVLGPGAEVTLGKRLAGGSMRALECLTNGIFGGKGQVIMQALFIAQSLNEGAKAEKGEKFSTFMASFMELMAFMATMGIQQRIVNHLAGLKYIGMQPSEVAKYKDFIKFANEAAKEKDLVKHTFYAAKAKSVMKDSKTGLSFFQKTVKGLGNLLSLGRIRETIKPLKSGFVSNVFSKIGYGLKVGTGYAGRVALIMAVIIPIFSGAAKKVSYALFGKPNKTLEREKQKELEEQQKYEAEQREAEAENKAPSAVPAQSIAQAVQPAKPGNLVDAMASKNVQPAVSQPLSAQPMTQPNMPYYQQPVLQPVPQYYQAQPMAQPMPAMMPQQPMQTMQTQPAQQVQQPMASASLKKSPDAGIKRTYVPNPILGPENSIIKPETKSAEFDKLMKQADLAEAQARQWL